MISKQPKHRAKPKIRYTMFAYIYSRRRYRRVLMCLWGAYALFFITRCILYIYIGPEALLLPINRILAVVSSGFLGSILTMMIIKRRSAPVPKPPVE